MNYLEPQMTQMAADELGKVSDALVKPHLFICVNLRHLRFEDSFSTSCLGHR